MKITLSQLFSLGGLLVLPFWFAMIVLPRWGVTRRVMQSPLVSAGAAALYLALVLPRLGEILPVVSGGPLAAVAALLGSPVGATIAWVHFLAFDLFVGRWAYLDSQERSVHPLVMAPVLLGVFMLGPIGYLFYLGTRAVAGFHPAAPVAVTSPTPSR